MKHWTILGLYTDCEKKTFYLQNWNWSEDDIIKNLKLDDDEISIFRKCYFNGFEKDINDNELKLLFEYVITNMQVLGVYELRNTFNRDQKTINIIKDNERKIWLAKGYSEIDHCDKQIDINTSRKKTIVNKRDYLYILNEKINEYESTIDLMKAEYETKSKKLEEELESLRLTIRDNAEHIKRQNWYIQDKKNVEDQYKELKEKFDVLCERYKKGQEICEKQYESFKSKWPEELKQLEKDIMSKRKELESIAYELEDKKYEVKQKEERLQYLSNYIAQKESIIDSLCNRFNL